MRLSKYINIGEWLLLFAIALFFISNFYFGWNEQPESTLELMIDRVVSWSFGFGLGLYFIPLFAIYKSHIRYRDTLEAIAKKERDKAFEKFKDNAKEMYAELNERLKKSMEEERKNQEQN